MQSERVYVSGVGVISSIGCNFDEFSVSVREGRCGAFPAYEAFGEQLKDSGLLVCKVRDFDANKHFSEQAHATMDPLAQFSLVASREAMAMAKLDPKSVDMARAGVIFGTAAGGGDNKMRYVRQTYESGTADPALLRDFPYHGTGSRIAEELGWRGPNVVFSSSCASASMAIGYAFESIRNGKAEVLMTGGGDFLGMPAVAIFNSTRLLAKGPMRPFDKNRSGIVLGEGAGMLCLESESHLRKRGGTPLCEIVGWGLSAEAHSNRAYEPTGRWIALAMSRALERAKVAPEKIDYANLHGNATEKDLSELRAMKKVFGEYAYQMPFSATKPMYGYLAGSAGAVDAICILSGMLGGFVPPTINLETQDPRCDLDIVPNVARKHNIEMALSANSGLGGSCSVLIMRSCSNYIA